MGEFSFESDAFNQVTQVLNDLELKIHKSDSGLGILEDVWSKIQCNPDVIQEAKNVVVIGDQCASLVRRIKLAMETSSFEIPEVLEVRRHVDDLHDRMMIKDHLETELKAVVSRVLATELMKVDKA